jgi:hypothetical protein
MNQPASRDRSVVAHNVRQSVIVPGDRNSIELTINQAAPRVPSLLPVHQVLAGQFDAGRLFHHRHALVGRDAELAMLLDAVRNPERRVIVLPAYGGAGKTRLLLELTDRLTAQSMTVLWATESPMDANALAEIPVGRAVVVVDDVHRRSDLPALLQQIAARRDVTLVAATRPHGLRQVQVAAVQAGHDDTSLLTLPQLGPLDREAARALAAAAVGHRSDDSLTLADSTAAYPLLTVVGGHLLARDQLRPAQLAGHGAYREQILARWADESMGALREDLDPTLVRRSLATITALAPYREDVLAEALAGFLEVPDEELGRLVGELEAAGLLARRGALLRVAPDVLADELLRRQAVTVTSRPTGFVEQVVTAFPAQLTTVLRNIAEVDYRLRGQGQDVDLLSVVWQGFRNDVLSGGAVHRYERLQSLSGLGFYQPERTLELVEDLLTDPVEPESRSELFALEVTQHDLDHAIAGRLAEVAYHLEHVSAVCDLLWQLGRDDACDRPQRDEHPLSVLSKLAGYEATKPLAYQEAVVDQVVTWLGDHPTAGAAGKTPLGLLQAITEKGGTTTRSSGWALEFGSFYLDAARTAQLRRRVRDLAAVHLTAPDVRVAADAVALLEGFLREPVAFYGGTVPDGAAESWRDEQLGVLEVLQDAAETGGLQPLVALRVREAVTWQARHGQNAVQLAARWAWQVVTDRYSLDLLVELSGAFALHDEDLDSDPFDHEARHASAAARRDQLIDQLLTEHSPAELLDYLETLCGLFGLAGKGPVNPTPLLWRLGERAPDRAAELAELLAQGTERPLISALRPLLAAVLAAAPARAVEIAQIALDDGSVARARAVAGAWAWPPWPWSSQELRSVFAQVISHEDPVTRTAALGRLRTLAHEDPGAAAAAALDVQIDSSAVAEEVATLLVHDLYDRGYPLPDPAAVNHLLRSLAPLPDLGGYWVGELLRRLAQEHLLAVTRFLLERINLARDEDATTVRVEAVPFQWTAASEGQRVADLPGAAAALRLVRDAALEPDSAHQWWTPKLFAALAGGYGELALQVLREFVDARDEAHVLGAARLLTEAPNRFVLDQVPFVVEVLATAHRLDADCLSQVESALWGSAFGGVRMRTPGEPDPEDTRLRDRARELAMVLPLGPARSFYRRLARDAEANIADDLRRDDERLQ